MGRFLRSKKLRYALWKSTDGKCAICDCELPVDWHADHIVPYVETQSTNVHEMQPLCPGCNLTKGARMTQTLRQHQQQAKAITLRDGEAVLAHVVPGGGKSWLPALLAGSGKIAWFVPKRALKRQAVLGMRKLGIELRDSGNDINPSRGSRGFVACHQSLTANTMLWRDELARNDYLLVVDELHHAMNDGTLAKALEAILVVNPRTRVLFMTGTLERNDRRPIYGVEYGGDGAPIGNKSANYFIRYTREAALLEKAIVPMQFEHWDGPVKWTDTRTSELVEREKLSEVDDDDASAALVTALKTEIARELLRRSLKHFASHGKKMIVVCASQSDCRSAKAMVDFPSYLAISDLDDKALVAIKAFTECQGKAVLVTCQMAYEGLDVPEITHLCSLTHIRSVPWIYQMLARAWRAHPGKSTCYCFCPDDQRMREVIQRIKTEQEAVLAIRQDGRDGGDGPGERSFIPHSSVPTDYRLSSLDERPLTEKQRAAEAFCSSQGIDAADPRALAFMDLCGEETVTPFGEHGKTVREFEADLRREITSQACRIDKHKGLDFGTTQRELMEMNGWVSIKDMSVDQLQSCKDNLHGLV